MFFVLLDGKCTIPILQNNNVARQKLGQKSYGHFRRTPSFSCRHRSSRLPQLPGHRNWQWLESAYWPPNQHPSFPVLPLTTMGQKGLQHALPGQQPRLAQFPRQQITQGRTRRLLLPSLDEAPVGGPILRLGITIRDNFHVATPRTKASSRCFNTQWDCSRNGH